MSVTATISTITDTGTEIDVVITYSDTTTDTLKFPEGAIVADIQTGVQNALNAYNTILAAAAAIQSLVGTTYN